MITTFYKQNGKAIEVNDNSFSHAIDLGWTTEKPTEKKSKPKTKKAK